MGSENDSAGLPRLTEISAERNRVLISQTSTSSGKLECQNETSTKLTEPPRVTVIERTGFFTHVRGVLGSRVARNISALASERALLLINSLLATGYVARTLGPADWAVIAWCLAVVALATPIVGAVQPLLLRQVIEQPLHARRAYHTAIFISAMCSIPLALSALALLLLTHNPAEGTPVAAGLLLATVAFRPFALAEAYFQARLLMQRLVVARTLTTVSMSGLKVLVIAQNLGVPFLLGIYAVEQLLSMAAVLFLARVQGVKLLRRVPVDRDLGWRWTRLMIPTIGASLGVVLYLRADQLMLPHYVSHELVGTYSAAVIFAEIPYFLAIAVVTSLTPRLTNIFDNGRGREKFDIEFQRVTSHFVRLGLVLAGTMALVGPTLLTLLLGSSYSAAGGCLRILAFTTPFVFMGTLQSAATVLYSQQRLAVIRLVTAASFNIVVNLLLMPIYGIYAAAFTTVAAQAIAAWLGNYIRAETRHIAALQTSALLHFGRIKRPRIVPPAEGI